MTFTAKTQKVLKAEYLAELSKVFPSAAGDSYHRNRYGVFVPFGDSGILAIEKPQIQKRFWFGENERGDGDTGPGSMAFAISQCAAVRQKEGFFAYNLRDLEWNEPPEYKALYVGPAYVNHPECRCLAIVGQQTKDIYERTENLSFRMMTSHDHEYMAAAYRYLKRDMEKRLNTYWNRYGAKHISAHTYWTER